MSPPQQGGRGGGQPAVPVTIAQVEQKAMPIALTVIGTAEAYSNVAVRAQTTGELTSVNFREGDDVAKLAGALGHEAQWVWAELREIASQ